MPRAGGWASAQLSAGQPQLTIIGDSDRSRRMQHGAMRDDSDRIGEGGRHVLVVEDDYFIAEDLAAAVAARGDTVLGPVPDTADALALIDRPGQPIDAALLDVQLRDEHSGGVADALTQRGIAFAFVTGNRSAVAPRHADRPVLDKPFSYAAVAALLDRLAPGRRAEDAPPE